MVNSNRMRRRRMPLRIGGMAMASLLVLTGGVSAAEAYRLGVADKIRVRIVEWQAADSKFEEWTALGGEYVVGPTGTTAFPFVGETESAGKSTTELAGALSEGLRTSLGLISAPNVTIEIFEFGPVYVTGDVQAPGEYKFAPGLNVIKALSLAGGERRSADASGRAEKELISVNGTFDVLREQHVRLLARRARLDAELANAAEIAVPEALAEEPTAESLIAVEQGVLQAHVRQMNSQVTALDGRVALLTREVESFEQKRQSVERQLQLAQEQLANVRELADDGLTLVSRVAALETNVADFESRLLDIDTAALQARQDIGEAEQERAELADVRVSELTLERQDVDGQLAELALKIGTQQGLIREAVAYSGVQVTSGQQVPSYSYTIIRQGEEIAADMTTQVQAGDVVVARLALAE